MKNHLKKEQLVQISHFRVFLCFEVAKSHYSKENKFKGQNGREISFQSHHREIKPSMKNYMNSD